MFTKRIIPCLDVKNGRVVKGVNFVDLKDAGDPVASRRPMTRPGPMSWSSSILRLPLTTGRLWQIW